MNRLLVLAVLACPVGATAYRPFNGTDADVVGPQEVELEIGVFSYLRERDHHFLVTPALIANYGFAPDLELVLEGRELFVLDPDPGMSRVQLLDTALSVKWVAREGEIQEKPGPSLAFELSALLPQTGNTTPGAELATIFSRRWDALTFHLNGALALTREQQAALFGALILEGPNRWMVRPVSELFVERVVSGGTEISGLVGAIWRLRENLTVDVGYRLSRVKESGSLWTVWEVRSGLSWAFSVGPGERTQHPLEN